MKLQQQAQTSAEIAPVQSKPHLKRPNSGNRSPGVCFNPPNRDHIAEENPLSKSWTLADSPSSESSSAHDANPPFSLAFTPPHMHSHPLPRPQPGPEICARPSSASTNKTLVSLPPPHPGPSGTQWSELLPEAAANSSAPLCPFSL